MSRAIVILLFGVLFSSLLTLPASAETSTANSVSPLQATVVKIFGGCSDFNNFNPFNFSPSEFCGEAQFTVTSNSSDPIFGFQGVEDIADGQAGLGAVWVKTRPVPTALPPFTTIVTVGIACYHPAGPHTLNFFFDNNQQVINVTIDLVDGPPVNWQMVTWFADCEGRQTASVSLDQSLPPSTLVASQIITAEDKFATVDGSISQIRSEFGSTFLVPYGETLKVIYPSSYNSYQLLSPDSVSSTIVADTVVSANYSSGFPLWSFLLLAFIAGLAVGLLARGYKREKRLRRHYQALYLSSARTEDAEEKEGERR